MKIGVIGLGMMGRVHLGVWQKIPDVNVVAVCDRNPTALADAVTQIDTSVERDAQAEQAQNIAYEDVDSMLEQSDVEAVSLTLPTWLHADMTVKCLENGVHVLCEKPMALTLEECDRMIAAAKKSGKCLMIAHCIRFWPEYVWAKQVIDDGRYGKVLAADFRRLSALPQWGSRSWFADSAKSGGVAMDLHIHDIDFISYVFEKPGVVQSRGVTTDNGSLGHLVSFFEYCDNRVVTATGGWMMAQKFAFKMTFEIALERATLVFDSGRKPTLQVYLDEGEPFTPELEEGDGYSREIEHFVALVAGKEDTPIITPEDARESVKLALDITASAQGE